MLIAIVLIALTLGFANGANDNFKGVATLLGSGTTSYRGALTWATVTTALGSLTALIVARELLSAFSGKGLVPLEVVSDPAFPAAVALAAGLTVLVATRIGLPISTTHALIGALVGAGLIVSPTGIETTKLVSGFIVPLLSSPILAIVLAAGIYPLLRFARKGLGIGEETCVCVGQQVIGAVPGRPGSEQAMQAIAIPALSTGEVATCEVRYAGNFLGLSANRALDAAHFLSGGAVCFARGLNDTPKIAALLLVGAVSPGLAIVAIGVVIAVGGLVSARRVAETMAHRVTDMNAGQGFTANIVTAVLVIGASKLGLPVSTTHVSCGSLFGIGTVTKRAHWRTIAKILLAWVITLPMAGLLAAGFALLLS